MTKDTGPLYVSRGSIYSGCCLVVSKIAILAQMKKQAIKHYEPDAYNMYLLPDDSIKDLYKKVAHKILTCSKKKNKT